MESGLVKVDAFFLGSPFRKDVKRSGRIRHIVCHQKSRICFLVSDDKVILQTNVQTFILEPVEVPGALWRRRYNKIHGDILRRKIRSLDELIRACGEGVEIVPTRLSYHV